MKAGHERPFPKESIRDSLFGDEVQQESKREEDRDIVDGCFSTRLFGIVLCEEAIGASGCNEEKHLLVGCIPEQETDGQHDGALNAAESVDRGATVQHPDRNQIQQIEPCAGVCERSPDGKACLSPDGEADGGGQCSGEWTGEANFGNGLLRNVKRAPTNVGTESGQKDRHVCGQSATTYIDIVSHLVDEDENGESDSERPSVEIGVHAKEYDKAQERTELEYSEKTFRFREQDENGS